MNIIIVGLFGIVMGLGCSGTQKNRATVEIKETAKTAEPAQPQAVILTGWLDAQTLLQKVPGYREDYDAYLPNAVAVSELRECTVETMITVFLGTWCPDTARELPRFLRALDAANNPLVKVKYFGVNRGFREKDETAKSMAIIAVPTFIITSGDKEIARIIETPELSIEEDVAMALATLQGKSSQN